MVSWFKNLFKSSEAEEKHEPMDMLRKTGTFRTLQPVVKPEQPPKTQEEVRRRVQISHDLGGTIESSGPGKNVLNRKRMVREDSGTHDTLKILDDSLVETSTDSGMDPYNTGQFDRSKNWDLSQK